MWHVLEVLCRGWKPVRTMDRLGGKGPDRDLCLIVGLAVGIGRVG